MWERDIFDAAAAIADDAERSAFLDEACANDPALRQHLEGLLQARGELGDFLEAPAIDLLTTKVEAPLAEPDAAIGSYRLLEQIGEGGFGLVFLAEQQVPIRRRVAVKVLKPGMDSKQVIARFEAERQALALMDHPNIARVLDGGETASGRPFFVMDLVHGPPITDYCDQHQLTPRQRLELFVSVCQAVQHAHQKAIIHRDLKPSNVLVAQQDGAPVVKIIDFGIAKALGQPLTDKTLYTGFAQMIGTPAYMSPEQVAPGGLDVDTRSDIYSLGVLLYELLTGTTPFDRERLQQASYDEIRRIIREEEPCKPSTRISTLGLAATTVSAKRQTEPKRLSLFIRGELDWIVMKALEKERDRRYQTVGDLTADIERYLHDQPVQASPPSVVYRFRKLVRRNRTGLAIAGLGLFLVVSLGAGVGWTVRDRVARQQETERAVLEAVGQAEMHLRDGDQQMGNPVRWQMTVALAEGATQRAEELLATGTASVVLVDRVRQIREAVDTARVDCGVLVALDRIELEKATVRDGYFDSTGAGPRYMALLHGYGVNPSDPIVAAGRLRDSRVREALLAAVEDWRRITRDAADRQSLETLLQAAEPAAGAFRARWLAAVRRGDRAELAQLSGEPAVQDLPAAAILSLSRDLTAFKQWSAAERLLRAGQEQWPGNFWLNHDLGMLLARQPPPRGDEALRYLTAALALRSDSPGVYVNLGTTLYGNNDMDGAIRAFQTALKLDPNYAMAHNNLGLALWAKKDVDGAIRAYQAALAINPNYAEAHNNLGLALWAKKDARGAIRAYQAAVNINPNLGEAHMNLGWAYKCHGQWKQAVNHYTKAMQTERFVKPAREHRRYAFAVLGLWVNAAADLAPAGIDSVPLDDTWFDLACVRVLEGDTSGYQQLCGKWLERVGQEKESLSGVDAFRSSRICMLHPDVQNDLAKGLSWAKMAVASQPKCPWYLHCIALAHYRAGDFVQAITSCNDSLQADPRWSGNPQNWLLIGLARKRLGQTREAGEWFDKSRRWRAGAMTGRREAEIAYPPEVELADWLEFQVLWREAETLLGPS
jgi:serine/threonine protein kinase/tetratricopeptide (TPR) repeat protein